SFLSEGEKVIKLISEELLNIAKKTRKKDIPRALSIDPSHIIKMYAEQIENLSKDRTGCTKRVEKCLTPIFAVLSDQNTSIPINVAFWVQEKVIGKKKYKSKYDIVKDLILKLIEMKVEF